MNRRTHRAARCLGGVLASSLILAPVLAAVPSYARVPRAPHAYTSSIERLAGYSPQRRCSPFAKPGTTALANLLLRTYPHSRSLGIVRACGVGGTSEHKEGRAFDWGVSAFSARDRHSVRSVVHWLFQRDRFGNRYAMARRLGIQYMIWNHRIWGSYSASSGWRRYTGSDPHTNHVHFSLSWKGARKLTSFWHPHRFGPPGAPTPTPTPTPTPPTPRPTPTPTPTPTPAPTRPALPEPGAPRTLKPGPVLAAQRVALPASRRAGVLTRGSLRKGHHYLIEASGTFKYGPGRQAYADAECSTGANAPWSRTRSVRRSQPGADHLDLYIDGHDLLSNSDNHEDCDLDSHTYRWVYRAHRTGRAPLKIWDPSRFADNSGRLSVRVIDLDARARLPITFDLPSKAAAGVTSPASLRAGVAYNVTVAGTWDDGGDLTLDGECSTTGADAWVRDRVGDHDLRVDRDFDQAFEPLRDTGDRCDTGTHAYRYTFTPSETRPINLRVYDPAAYADNTGTLKVTIRKHVDQPAPAVAAASVPGSAPAPAPVTAEKGESR